MYLIVLRLNILSKNINTKIIVLRLNILSKNINKYKKSVNIRARAQKI